MSFLGEIKRRKVFQVAAVYLVVAWLIMQVVDVVNEPLSLPDWFDTVAIMILAIGLPIALITTWAFEITPEGVLRDAGGDMPGRAGNRNLEWVLIGLLVVAVGFILVDNYVLEDAPDAELVADEPVETLPPVAVEEQPDVLPNSVAVLPFQNLSPDPDNAYFAAGVHESILNELAKIQDLSVIARTSVLKYAGGATPIPDIAAELNVETVMEGSVRYAGDRVRITAQLIDPATGAHLWSEEYDRDLDDIFAIQSDIAEQIAMALEAELSPAERQRIERQPTDSPEAWQYYLRAREILPNIGGAVADFAAFHRYLDQAIVLDPEFALAMAAKAGDYAFAARRPQLSDYESLTLTEREVWALGYAHKALSIDPDLGLGHMALGLVYRFNRRGAEAVAEFERAYRLSPNDADVLDDYGRILSLTGQHEDAIRIARRTAELRPNYPGLADFLVRAGDFTAAVEIQREIVSVDPWYGAHLRLALYEFLIGNNEAAHGQLRFTETAIPNTNLYGEIALLPYVYGRLGDSEAALRSFTEIELRSEIAQMRPATAALAYLGIGDEQRALERLLFAAENRRPENMDETSVDVAFNSFQDPALDRSEFVEVRSRLGFRE